MKCENNEKHRVFIREGRVAIDGVVSYKRVICRDCGYRGPMVTAKGKVELPKEKE
jgi:hypothetical protein